MIKVVFCVPGRTFSNRFFNSWSNLLLTLPKYDVAPAVSTAYSNNIYWVRDLCLGGTIEGPPNQKPFGNQYTYDYIMWVDSDSIFEPQQFKMLLGRMQENRKYQILAGIYPLEDNRYATHFLKSKQNRYITVEDVARGLGDKPFKVWYTGMGFMLIRNGVFEKLTYPWFTPIIYTEKGGAKIISGDDSSFCERVKESV